MIGTLRKHSQWLWAIIIVVVIISFVVFFSPDARLGRGAGEADYGTLYGEPVKRDALLQAYADARLGYFLSTGQCRRDRRYSGSCVAWLGDGRPGFPCGSCADHAASGGQGATWTSQKSASKHRCVPNKITETARRQFIRI